ncbi:sugar phosphate isomerase/epimerase family protein [Enemella evansiae]|uniref:sugar phosphate isomerase/epimerase family protein n=2 Tax=Enemella evansiae TaxID=2016499 RepID=UPI000B96880E|nr:TIM barrel protein [Enemella evansiae]PFG68945.1 sugar phosphate isomerase/epimerase [Propionibacteriaceae bacterium ES.041]OYN96945.1 sugar phosphate isomerase [Enemella evansiae]OYO00622.1 sugar phosphate isomerase [Enemella evansiae]OYO06213.1 sugar phosphate isomerase [Enemella evansiae]OYO11901.1 sugar phosphate isomerase [Enemella evansiae]
MAIGLSTYAYFWRWHETAVDPMGWREMLDDCAEQGVPVFQFCDYPPLHSMTAAGIREIERHATRCGITLELGTRGLDTDHLRHYLELARASGVELVRSMVRRDEADRAVDLITAVLPAYEAAGVTIALETYEQVATSRLIEIVDEVGSEHLGICLDPANSVAALEMPSQTIAETAAWVKNLHVKDFAFTRQDGWVGFTYAGAPLGEGLLDYDAMVDTVQPEARRINQVIEHWLVWQGDPETTARIEDQWTRNNIAFLRRKLS